MEDKQLIMKECCEERFNPARIAVEKLLNYEAKETLLVAIDGKCASGKTTLGYYLNDIFDCNLFHMDDFFLQSYQRTKERLAEAGGNVDYERFQAEILKPVLEKNNVNYRPYNCAEGKINNGIMVPYKRLNIIEGSYSMHPYFGDPYDLHIFMDIDDEKQIENIRIRNGEEKLIRFKEEWIPKENAYFDKFNIKSNCIQVEWKKTDK